MARSAHLTRESSCAMIATLRMNAEPSGANQARKPMPRRPAFGKSPGAQMENIQHRILNAQHPEREGETALGSSDFGMSSVMRGIQTPVAANADRREGWSAFARICPRLPAFPAGRVERTGRDNYPDQQGGWSGLVGVCRHLSAFLEEAHHGGTEAQSEDRGWIVRLLTSAATAVSKCFCNLRAGVTL
jgi:hypothetical protein